MTERELEPCPVCKGECIDNRGNECERCAGRGTLVSTPPVSGEVGELVERLLGGPPLQSVKDGKPDLDSISEYLRNSYAIRQEAASALTAAKAERDRLEGALQEAMNAREEMERAVFRLARELEEARGLLGLIREEAAKDNAPFGRSDSLALNSVRAALASGKAPQ